MRRLFFLLALGAGSALPAWSQDIDWSLVANGAVGWESNTSNSDQKPEAVSSLTIGSHFDSAGRMIVPGDNLVAIGTQADFRAVVEEKNLDEVVVRPWVAFEHKFGLGAYAPVAGLRLTLSGKIAREADRSGTGHTGAIILRQRFGPFFRMEGFYEDSAFNTRADVYGEDAREGSILLAYDLAARWQLAAEFRLRHGDVVSFAQPPRADLRALTNLLTNVDFFGGRTAYSVRAHSFTSALAITYRAPTEAIYSLRSEYRDTWRGPLGYENLNFTASISRTF